MLESAKLKIVSFCVSVNFKGLWIAMVEELATPQLEKIIQLESRLTGRAVDSLHLFLLEKSGTDDPILIDASEVTLIDTTAIQVLLSAEKECISREKQFQNNNMSSDFIGAMTTLGLANVVDRWRDGNV
ncbi:STAS domain-containing protein [Hirschia baltica]|nr:STAS domain-containing protein [Hirschia baltica]